MSPEPSASNGRTPDGKFGPGNRAAAGTRQAHRQKLLRAFSEAITTDDIIEIAAALVDRAKTGDPAAVKTLLDRLWGRIPESLSEPAEDTEPPRVDMFAGLEGADLQRAIERERSLRAARLNLEGEKAKLLLQIQQWEAESDG